MGFAMIEFALRALPEAAIFIYSVHVFANSKIERNRFVITSIMMGMLAIIYKRLPIHYGINTVLCIMTIIIFSVLINKIEMLKAIKASILTVVIQFVSEYINIFMLQFILGNRSNLILMDPIKKLIWCIPSLIIMIGILIIYKKGQFKFMRES